MTPLVLTPFGPSPKALLALMGLRIGQRVLELAQEVLLGHLREKRLSYGFL